MQPLGIRQIRYSVKCPVDDAVTIHQQYLFPHIFHISIIIIATRAAMARAWVTT